MTAVPMASAMTLGVELRLRVCSAWRGSAGRSPCCTSAPPAGLGDHETSGSDEHLETAGRLQRIPDPMTAVPAMLLTAALAVGVIPGFAEQVAHHVEETGSDAALCRSVGR
ncbi:hypothetical protein [Streptomyces sp. NPDC058683]|uniref:hypothetical protein n=1 Tax=Streptomyces sp. NPDC058683 TaxID=3346597 RepID=UPI003646E913